MTVAELIKELERFDPTDRVAYAYLTYRNRSKGKRRNK